MLSSVCSRAASEAGRRRKVCRGPAVDSPRGCWEARCQRRSTSEPREPTQALPSFVTPLTFRGRRRKQPPKRNNETGGGPGSCRTRRGQGRESRRGSQERGGAVPAGPDLQGGHPQILPRLLGVQPARGRSSHHGKWPGDPRAGRPKQRRGNMKGKGAWHDDTCKGPGDRKAGRFLLTTNTSKSAREKRRRSCRKL